MTFGSDDTQALRHVLFTSANDSPTRNIVIQLARPCKHMASATFCDDGGRRLIRPMDLSLFMNSLIFACAAQEGLAHVLMMLLDAEGFSFKRRKAHLFCGGVIGKTIGDCDDMLEKGAVIGVMPTNWGGEDVPPGPRPARSCLVAGGAARRPPTIPRRKPRRRPRRISPRRSKTTRADVRVPALAGMGLAPDMDYVVKRGDLIIFVSDTISPPPSSAHEDGSAAADVEAAKLLEPAEGFDTPHASMQALICGWRPVWTDESKRLRARVEQITLGMGAGSAVYFINAVPEDLFKRLIEVECGFSAATFSDGKAGWATAQGVELRHVPGDAADQEDLEPLVHAISFDVAIVLGSQARAAGDALSPANMDTRVLDILLLLRHVHATSPNPNKYLHVIGENNVDETAMLALAPRTKDSLNKPPDFINTQAIYARALTLTLAYPRPGRSSKSGAAAAATSIRGDGVAADARGRDADTSEEASVAAAGTRRSTRPSPSSSTTATRAPPSDWCGRRAICLYTWSSSGTSSRRASSQGRGATRTPTSSAGSASPS